MLLGRHTLGVGSGPSEKNRRSVVSKELRAWGIHDGTKIPRRCAQRAAADQPTCHIWAGAEPGQAAGPWVPPSTDTEPRQHGQDGRPNGGCLETDADEAQKKDKKKRGLSKAWRLNAALALGCLGRELRAAAAQRSPGHASLEVPG